MLSKTYKLSLQPGTTRLRIPISQRDKGETLVFKLVHKATSADISSGVSAEISGTKPNGVGFTHSVSYSSATATVTLANDMTDIAGDVLCEITLTKGSGNNQMRLSTANFILEVEKDPYTAQ